MSVYPPHRVLNLSTSSFEEAFQPRYEGAHYTAALRLPYIMSGLHLVLIHTSHSGVANSRTVASWMFRVVCRVHGEDASEAVFAQLVRGVMDGSVNPDMRGVEGAVLLNLVLYMVFGLLSSLPQSLSLSQTLLGFVEKAAVGHAVDVGAISYAVSLLVTAVGQLVRRRHPGTVVLADRLAKAVLLPLARAGWPFRGLADFLRETCEMMGIALPQHIAALCVACGEGDGG